MLIVKFLTEVDSLQSGLIFHDLLPTFQAAEEGGEKKTKANKDSPVK
jgi:hypothetical protein